MVQHLIVPVDGSNTSWSAVDVALALARRCDADVQIFEVVFSAAEVEPVLARAHDLLSQRDVGGVEVAVDVEFTEGSVASQIDAKVHEHPEATIVMASHGRGRSAALIGSIAEQVLAQTFGPIMIVGPHVGPDDFSGAMVVSVDGSQESEAALPLAAAWAIELRSELWVVHASGMTPAAIQGGDVLDTAYTARLAHDLQRQSGHRVEFTELHEANPAVSVPDFAEQLGAALIVTSSHGRTGWSRLTAGSVTSGYIRNAKCPVLVVRLPHHPDTR